MNDKIKLHDSRVRERDLSCCYEESCHKASHFSTLLSCSFFYNPICNVKLEETALENNILIIMCKT